jgi:hypothetical protein
MLQRQQQCWTLQLLQRSRQPWMLLAGLLAWLVLPAQRRWQQTMQQAARCWTCSSIMMLWRQQQRQQQQQ